MRNNTQDTTLQREYMRTFKFLVGEYERVKKKEHPTFRFVKEFYAHHRTCAKTFMKYYHRYKQSGKEESFLPQKRGPKWKSRRPLPFIENKVIEQRQRGNNKYEIQTILLPKLKRLTPSPSGIYNICKRYGLNKKTKPMKSEKRKIIKERIGQLGHIDCHYLPKGIIQGDTKIRYYLVALMDDYSRLVEVDIVKDIKSLTVMFSTLKMINFLNKEYGIQFQEILSDNGPEFGSKANGNREHHPFERMLIELGIIHRYTRPFRPQTNGKIERFWKTIEEDLIAETDFDTIEELQKEIQEYVYYFNHCRPHSSLDGLTPFDFAKKVLPN